MSDCDCEIPDLYNAKIVKVRKPHKCVECRTMIEKGEKAEKADSLYDGEFRTYYTCESCLELITHLRQNGVDLCCYSDLSEALREEGAFYSEDELEEIYSTEPWYDDDRGCVRGRNCPIVTKVDWLKIVNGRFRLVGLDYPHRSRK